MMSTETSGDVSEAELGKSEPRGSGPKEDNTRAGPQRQIQAPLGVELTGYRLLTTGVILGFGIPKAVYSYNGQALISTTLDWVAGIILTLILYWLSVIEAHRPELSPRFFQADLAPPILNFLCRPEVHLWLFSVLPLLQSTKQLWAMLDELAGGNQTKDRLALAVLAFSAAICIFCLQCLRVVWPRGFEGTPRHVLLFVISSAMWLAYDIYLVVKVFNRSPEYPRSIINVAVHNLLWLYPFALLPLPGTREVVIFGYIIPSPYDGLVMPACVVFTEAVFMCVWGLPEFPEGLYGTLFLFCITIFFSAQFLLTVSKFLVLFFARTWGTSNDRVRRATRGARVSVSGTFNKVLKAVRQGWVWLFNGYERSTGQ